MIPKAVQSSLPIWWPPALLAIFSGALQLAGPRLIPVLEYERAAVAAGQWYRLLTSNFVHLGWWHWTFNALSLVLLVALCPERVAPLDWLLRVVFVSVGTCLGLYWGSPGISAYVGLSGMIYGLFFLGLSAQAIRGDRIAYACLAFLACRIGWEYVVGIPPSEERLIGGRVVPESHLYGVAAAFVYAVLAAMRTRLVSSGRQVP